MHKNKAYS